MKTIKNQLLELSKQGNSLNIIYSELRKNGLHFKKEVFEFGLHTSKSANLEKELFLNEKTADNVIHLHYHSLAVKARSGYTYNRIRGMKITILDNQK